MQEILYGSLENVKIGKEKVHTSSDYFCAYDGIIDYLQKVMENDESASGKKWADQFISTIECPECHGHATQEGVARLPHLGQEYLRSGQPRHRRTARLARTGGSSICLPMKAKVAHEIIKELRSRVTFLLDVGLELSLAQPSVGFPLRR